MNIEAIVGGEVSTPDAWEDLDERFADVHLKTHDAALILPGGEAKPWVLCLDCLWDDYVDEVLESESEVDP